MPVTVTAMQLVLADGGAAAAGDRIAVWVRRYPAKGLARLLCVEPRTIRAWREGQSTPQLQHLLAMALLWGDSFLRDVFADALAETDTDLALRLATMRVELDRILLELRHATPPALPLDTAAGPPACAGRPLASAARQPLAAARAGLRRAAAFALTAALLAGVILPPSDHADMMRPMRTARPAAGRSVRREA